MFRIAHLSDIHLPLAPGLPRPLNLLANKRLLGFLSWHLRRKSAHRPELIEALLADIHSKAPDQIVITGDLTNTALPDEFERALAWLRTVGSPDRVMVVPGNHDAQIAMHWPASLDLWAPYLIGADAGDVVFPTVREKAGMALIGLSSARPTSWLKADGSIGAVQIAALERRLRALGGKGLFRVILLHHPPFPWAGQARKQLADWAALQGALGRAGAELILHGHMHQFAVTPIAAQGGDIVAFGVPSASAARGKTGAAGWNLYEVEPDGDGWRVEVCARELASDGQRFVTRSVQAFALPRMTRCSASRLRVAGWTRLCAPAARPIE
jgi:3',5'-cyclic AMP phosphodiesterase CpdA